MYHVDAFWCAAARYGQAIRWAALAKELGWEALPSASDLALLAAGLAEARLGAWRSTVAGESRGRPITVASPTYPVALLGLSQPPPVLFVEGEGGLLLGRCVAIVGTRGMTAYGDLIARRLGEGLAARGITVVSGLARGIDGAAHRGGLARTVAVVAHGLDHTAPPGHRGLRQQILDRGGAIVSTWTDGISPAPWMFPARNAVVAGLCEATVVVEAPERSGALITARLAGEFGRDVWAVPGQIGAPASAGCLRLLQDGANVVVDVDVFLDEVGGARGRRPDWQTLLFDGVELDRVATARGGSVSALLAELATQEVRGELTRLPGGRYAPCGA